MLAARPWVALAVGLLVLVVLIGFVWRRAQHRRQTRQRELMLLRLGEARGRQEVLDEVRLLEHGQLKTHVLAVQRCLTQARATAAIEQRVHWLDEGIRQVRRLLDVVVLLHQGVGSSALPDDLEQALVDIARSLAVAYPHCACQVEVAGLRPPQIGEPLRRAVALVLYNGLSNAYRHGEPSRISVRIQYAPDALILVVHDDGCGMRLDGPNPAGRGLRDMYALAAQQGGTLKIMSAPGAGTELRATFPVEPTCEDARGACDAANPISACAIRPKRGAAHVLAR